ncbi:MAG TPA: hypothetical protein VK601_18825, partial [Kofleriaceae bacterium]|nr:hypothetical protein [Kofleriaceae bacterium]
ARLRRTIDVELYSQIHHLLILIGCDNTTSFKLIPLIHKAVADVGAAPPGSSRRVSGDVQLGHRRQQDDRRARPRVSTPASDAESAGAIAPARLNASERL